MSTSETELKRLAHSEYWDERYGKVGPDEQVHEWFRSFNDLAPFFDRHLFRTIPEELSRKGYKNQICLDFSPVVVETMSRRHRDIEGITWQHADVRQMDQISSESVDVAFDKGTLDAMIYGSPWDPPDEVLDNTGRYVGEVFRILRYHGMFIYVTYRQPHFIKPLLNCEGAKWDIKVDALASSGNSLEYHGGSGIEIEEVETKRCRPRKEEVKTIEFRVQKVYVALSTGENINLLIKLH
ncbi:hypothetical protein DV736_g1964, partial [Chaetothyriales sp. CBS 134916]